MDAQQDFLKPQKRLPQAGTENGPNTGSPQADVENVSRPVAQPAKRRPRNDPPTDNEIELGLKMLEFATKKKLSSLRKILLLELCRLKSLETHPKITVPMLVNLLELWVSD